jgi:hypothetical protein
MRGEEGYRLVRGGSINFWGAGSEPAPLKTIQIGVK